MSTQRAKADAFHRLHDELLILPNAWDAASARMIEQAGAAAVATTSAGVAWSRGVADGSGLTRDVAVDVIARVAAAVSVPVTADIEWGYGDEPGGVAATIAAVVEAGAVGVNIEDSRNGQLVPALDHVRVLEEAVGATPFPVFVNARIDAFLLGVGVDEAIRRAELYVEAGVHGIFVPGATDPAEIGAVVAAVKAPVNVMVGPGSASMEDLSRAGVRRISLGAQLAQSAYGELRTWAQGVLTGGGWTDLPKGAAGSDLQ